MERALLIANPVSQSGKGAEAARFAEKVLVAQLGAGNIDSALTQAPGHARELAAQMDSAYDTVIALGGDGLVHEVANGLMARAPEDRSQVGLIPVGSGNDYVQSLGLSTKVERSLAQLLTGAAQSVDVGCCNGEYFVETLSFGIDAAIALDTMERRKKSKKSGTALYFEAGVYQLTHNLKPHAYRLALSGTQQLGEHALNFSEGVETPGQSITFAVQLGPTYGGGFHICPEAQLDDGLFDICIAHPPVSVPKAVGVFAMALNGHHTSLKLFDFARAKGLQVTFEEEPACQADGEKITGREYEVTLEPRALQVIC